jgi:hypothetical protein
MDSRDHGWLYGADYTPPGGGKEGRIHYGRQLGFTPNKGSVPSIDISDPSGKVVSWRGSCELSMRGRSIT